MSTQPPRDEPRLLLRPTEAFRLMSISKSKGYSLIACGEFPGVVRLGPRCTRIRSDALRRWLAGEEERE
jgi:predicted DNA-binding transcriptional regulator AlpA